MADTKVSLLTAVATPAGTDEFGVNQAGASKKMTLAQIRTSLPTLPTFVGNGALFNSTAVPTATMPTHLTDDILVLCLQQANQANVTAPAGWTQLGPQNGVGDSAVAGSTKLSVFWLRATSGATAAPTIPDTGDHTAGVIFNIRGCPTTGDPFDIGSQTFSTGSGTFVSMGGGTTAIRNCLVVDILAHAINSATAQASGQTNADLASVTEQFDASTTDGTGGGIVIISGIEAEFGKTSPTTLTLASGSSWVATRVIFRPSDSTQSSVRSIQVLTYLGSSTNLDDLWVKPDGAQRVFAQICDGGGSGSGGNTTTTAEGGGGGGGGGYDEAWYRADDLGATVTIHAGKGGAAGTALNQAGNIGVVSEFNKGGRDPLSSSARVAGIVPTAAASALGGAGGSGSGRGTVSRAAGSRIALEAATAGVATGGTGGRGGGPGGTAPVGGSPADWGGGGGESGGDTDAATAATSNGYSLRGAGGGSSGRTNTNISLGGHGGAATMTGAAQGQTGTTSSQLPYGGAGGNGGGSTVVTGGPGGFPGGGGGGGAGVAGGFGGRGGHGCVVVTTTF